MKPVALPFSLNSKPIDYFKIDSSYFPAPFQHSINKIPLTQNDYLDKKKWLKNNDNTNVETNVLNFQVGKGKTTFCYELVEHYQKKGYVIIWCSPFIKLINKDYENISRLIIPPITSTTKGGIKGKHNTVFNYLELSKKGSVVNFISEVAANVSSVHIMTINCLLGNSGDEVFDQNFHKKNYLENLIEVCKKNGKKVIMFLDEVHESTHNFQNTLIPNLLKWNGLIEKVFIASATYTAAAIPILKICSLLTNKNIRVFEADRIKNKVQAEINLHIGNFYKDEYKHFLSLIISEAQKYISKSIPINIITPTKTLAGNICSGLKLTTIEKRATRLLMYSQNHINLLIGKTDVEYSQGQNNIGTKFKTGVDITNPSEALFIVLPFNEDKKRTHIYSDGIPSIIQSMGRLRNGGKIHVFMSSPNFVIDKCSFYPSYFSSAVNTSFININQSYSVIVDEHKKKINAVKNEIFELEKSLQIPISTQKIIKNTFGVWYPNETEFLLKHSDDILMNHDNPSFGRAFSPYMLWACIYDQFINARLNNVLSCNFLPVKIKITKSDAQSNFQEIIADKIAKSKVTISNFRYAVNNLDRILGKTTDENKIEKDIKYVIDQNEKSFNSLVTKDVSFSQAALSSITRIINNYDFPFTSKDKQAYLFNSIVQASKQKDENIPGLIKSYNELGGLAKEFHKGLKSKIVKSNLLPVGDHDELIPDDFEKRFKTIFGKLKEEDGVLRLKSFDVFQSAKTKKQIADMMIKILYTYKSTTPTMDDYKKYYEIELRKVIKTTNDFSLF